MALTLIINNGEDYQAADITTAIEGLVGTAGVLDKAGGNFTVTQFGTPNKSVNVAAGFAYVPNSAYSIGSGNARYWPFRSSATENVTIPDNASGNPRIDRICLKVDTGASPGVRGTGSASVVCVTGTAAGSPSAPATPNDHLSLALIAVANGFSSIVTANITDDRAQALISNAVGNPGSGSLLPGAGAATGIVLTSESTTATSFTDLATVGPSVSVPISTNGKALIMIRYQGSNTGSGLGRMTFVASGANTIVTSSDRAAIHGGTVTGTPSFAYVATGLTSGTTVFTAKYRADAGTGTFLARYISVIPL